MSLASAKYVSALDLHIYGVLHIHNNNNNNNEKKVLRETQTCALALYNLIVHSSAAA